MPKDNLIRLLCDMGYPEEFGEIISQNLKSEKSINRMISYLLSFKPERTEDIVDEMLAIQSDVQKWRGKKIAEYYNSKYNEYLNSAPDDEY